jgi:hypothetical protein
MGESCNKFSTFHDVHLRDGAAFCFAACNHAEALLLTRPTTQMDIAISSFFGNGLNALAQGLSSELSFQQKGWTRCGWPWFRAIEAPSYGLQVGHPCSGEVTYVARKPQHSLQSLLPSLTQAVHKIVHEQGWLD